MNDYFKNHIGYKESIQDIDHIYDEHYVKYKKEIGHYFKNVKNLRVLEIGCGMGKFAYFCNKIGIKDYVGIDIDDYFFQENKTRFPKYNFVKIGFQNYLKDYKNEFDIIFVSHVFEHLDEIERSEIIRYIYDGLKGGGKWINYQPNADSIIRVGNGRYTDITHKTIYNEMSFTQVVNISNCEFEILNLNSYVGSNYKIGRIVHVIFRFFTKIYFLGMCGVFPKIYTYEFINILTKINIE